MTSPFDEISFGILSPAWKELISDMLKSIKWPEQEEKKKENKKQTLEIKDEQVAYVLTLLYYEFKRFNIQIDKVLKAVDSVSPGAFLGLLFMVLAKEMDAAYEDHISNAGLAYYVDPVGGKIREIDTKKLEKVTFKYVPVFRTKQDAIAAIRLAGKVRNYLYVK